MAFLKTLTNVFKRVSSKTLVGADKVGNKFFTYEDPNGTYWYLFYAGYAQVKNNFFIKLNNSYFHNNTETQKYWRHARALNRNENNQKS